MKRAIIIATIATAVFGACDNQKTVPVEQMQRRCDSLQAIIDGQRDDLNYCMGAITDIQKSIQQMSEAEGHVTLANSDPERVNWREEIRENMQFLSETMQQQRERISRLQERLKTSSLNVQKMQEVIDNLRRQLDDMTARIQELQAQIAERDEVINKQGETIASQDKTIIQLGQENEKKAQTVEAQDKQLNEAWYVFGTKAELKAQKIIDNGDVLVSGAFNKNYFTKIDIRTTREIKLYSKSAKLLTSHPKESYTLTKDSNGEYVLRITQTNKFWTISRYLVIQVK